MKNTINKDNVEEFCYSNAHLIKDEIKGICISFRGLGAAAMISDDTEVAALVPTVERARRLAAAGVLFFVPYLNPWNWMNAEAQATTDAVIDALIEKYSLPDNVPIVSSGGSMGGMCALTYMVYARRTPVACVVNCPVCDVVYHYTERPDLPRTFYSAYCNSGVSIDEALRAHSPLHLIDRLPQARYFLFHCEEDRAVNIDAHTKRLLRAIGDRLNVTFHSVAGRGHCALTEEMNKKYEDYIISSIT